MLCVFSVGRLIVTKAPGILAEGEAENDYQDLTLEYKPKEGSIEERLALMKAVRTAGGDVEELYPGTKSSDVFMQLIDLDKGR